MLKHAFVSAKSDDTDPSLVQASHWNADHAFEGGALGSLLYRDTGAASGGNWLADVAAGSVLVSGGVGAAPAWSSGLHLYDSNTTPSSLTGSPFQISVNQSVFGAAAIMRLENTSIGAATGMAFDFLCGDVAGNDYAYGRMIVNSPHHANPGRFTIGSGSAHDLVLTTGGGTILQFNRTTIPAAGPYFIMFGGTDASWPAVKRNGASWQFRKADDSGDTSIIASTAQLSALPAFTSGAKYVVVDASGNLRISALGPAS